MESTRVIATYLEPISANIVRARLQEEGVGAFLEDEEIVATATAYALAYGGVKLRVPESQIERAMAILAEIEEGPGEEWDEQGFEEDEGALEAAERALALPRGGELVCPSCGSEAIGLGLTGKAMFGLTAVVLVLPFVVSQWTAWGTLLQTYGVRLGAFLAFVSVALYFIRAFDMRCKDCGHEEERAAF